MIDWHQRAEEALGRLRSHAGGGCYSSLQEWLECLYEQEKEGLAFCQDPEKLLWHWLRIRGIRELLQMLEDER